MSTAPSKPTHFIRLLLVNGASHYLYFTSEVAAQSVMGAMRDAKSRPGGGTLEVCHLNVNDGTFADSILDTQPVFMTTMEAFGP